MNKIKSGLVAVAVLAGFSGTALAEGSGYYGAVDFGQSRAKDACADLTGMTVLTCSDTGTAIRGSLGYQVNPGLELEASYADVGDAAKANVIYLGVPVTATITGTSLQFSAVGSLPISDVFALTGKIGVAFTDAKATGAALGVSISTSESNTTLAYGVGIRCHLNKTVALRAQYEDLGNIKTDASGSGGSLQLLTVGAMYSF